MKLESIFRVKLSSGVFAVLLLASLAGVTTAGESSSKNLDAELQSLKKDALSLNRDLFVLEEELLFPSSTQVAVFVSLDVGKFFALDSVQLKVDEKPWRCTASLHG
jgi:hypothetical protein